MECIYKILRDAIEVGDTPAVLAILGRLRVGAKKPLTSVSQSTLDQYKKDYDALYKHTYSTPSNSTEVCNHAAKTNALLAKLSETIRELLRGAMC